MASTRSIVVVGAGVLGLSTAILLQERCSNASITIVAAEMPTASPMHIRASATKPSADYASMWAGAHYRPIAPANAQLVDEERLAQATAQRMLEIARSHGRVSGVQIVPAEEYMEKPAPEVCALKSGDVYAFQGDDFQVFSQTELDSLNAQTGDQGEVKWAIRYTTYVVNVHLYCAWLLERFVQNGGRVEQRRLGKLEEAFTISSGLNKQLPVVVNCSGRNFDTDQKTGIIRGQTVLVRQQYGKTITRQNADGTWSFLIPRPQGGGTIVGGTKEVGDHETNARLSTRQKLLEMAAKYYPDFVAAVEDFEVVQDNVGRRPWREGGLRIEVERMDEDRTVVHGYGAGGRGYELSWGAADRIVGLVEGCMGAVAARL